MNDVMIRKRLLEIQLRTSVASRWSRSEFIAVYANVTLAGSLCASENVNVFSVKVICLSLFVRRRRKVAATDMHKKLLKRLVRRNNGRRVMLVLCNLLFPLAPSGFCNIIQFISKINR